jgi:hypothetical protein
MQLTESLSGRRANRGAATWRVRPSTSSRHSKAARTRLTAETPAQCKSSDRARRIAASFAETRVGVVVFSTSGDAELGDYDEEPTILFKAGRLPPPFEDA